MHGKLRNSTDASAGMHCALLSSNIGGELDSRIPAMPESEFFLICSKSQIKPSELIG